MKKLLRIHPFAKKLVSAARRLSGLGLAPGIVSSMTAYDEGLLWLTSAGCDFATLSADDLRVLWPDGKTKIGSEGRQSHTDACLHQSLLEKSPGASVIIQAYLPKTMSFLAKQRMSPDEAFLKSTLLKFHIDEQLSASAASLGLSPQSTTAEVVIRPGLGVFAYGQTPDEAVSRLSLLEALVQA